MGKEGTFAIMRPLEFFNMSVQVSGGSLVFQPKHESLRFRAGCMPQPFIATSLIPNPLQLYRHQRKLSHDMGGYKATYYAPH